MSQRRRGSSGQPILRPGARAQGASAEDDRQAPEPETPETPEGAGSADAQVDEAGQPEPAAPGGRTEPAAPGGRTQPAAPGGGAVPIDGQGEAPEETRAGVERRGAFARMYRGQTSFDFVGRWRWWFALSGAIILAGLLSLGFRGLNFGIDFKGGTAWTVLAPGVTQTQATNAVEAAGVSQPVVEILGGKTVQVQADLNGLPATQQKAEQDKVSAALADLAHISPDKVSITSVGPNWGGQVTERALIALLVFFAAVSIYLSVRFEPKMALAAFIAMIHDLLVTVGVYSLAGFQVTPDTVIAILTILGYSLYDTVVVFDRVRENARGLGSTGRMTYTDMVNLSMNQTLARSINTSLVAVLPVLAVLVVGAEILGAASLKDYGLALFIGLMSGAYSSIFIASPVLALLKEREPRYAAIRQRLETRGERGVLTPTSAAVLVGAAAGGGGARRAAGRSAASTDALRPATAGAARAGSAVAAPRPPGSRPAGRPAGQGPRPRKSRKGGKGRRR